MVPDCTNLISPVDGATDIPILPEIRWSPVPEATGYRISTNGSTSNGNDFDGLIINSGTEFNFPVSFDYGETVTVTIIPFNTDGDAVGCTSETFTIVSAVPNPPSCTNMTSPLNGETDIVADLASISWNPVGNANGYRLTINGSASDTNDVADLVVNGTSHPFTNDFDNGETVTVTIIPFNTDGDAVGCTSETFTIVSSAPTLLGCAELNSPVNGSTDIAVDLPNITWNAVDGATGYRLEITSTSGKNDLTFFDVGNILTHQFAESFDFGDVVTMNIVPYNDAGNSTGTCNSETFTITSAPSEVPNCTDLISPTHNTTDIAVDIVLSWNEVDNADGYRLRVGSASGSSDILDADMGMLTSYTLAEELPYETTVFISITPYNSEGDAIGCKEMFFTTIADLENPNENETKYGFSPDGDGINEFWVIDGIENHPENVVYIYNRWGDMVFQIEGYDNQSNVFRGEANRLTGFGADILPSGTYFFRIQIAGETNLKKLTGYLVLKR